MESGKSRKAHAKVLRGVVGKVGAIREIRSSIDAINAVGGKAVYIMRYRRRSDVKSVIRTIEEDRGMALTGIWHAAGVVRISELKAKRKVVVIVYGVSHRPLEYSSETDSASIKHLVVFSSLAMISRQPRPNRLRDGK